MLFFRQYTLRHTAAVFVSIEFVCNPPLLVCINSVTTRTQFVIDAASYVDELRRLELCV